MRYLSPHLYLQQLDFHQCILEYCRTHIILRSQQCWRKQENKISYIFCFPILRNHSDFSPLIPLRNLLLTHTNPNVTAPELFAQGMRRAAGFSTLVPKGRERKRTPEQARPAGVRPKTPSSPDAQSRDLPAKLSIPCLQLRLNVFQLAFQLFLGRQIQLIL